MKNILYLLILWFFCQACYFSPALRTGRTLQKGQQQVGANVTTFVIPDDDGTEENIAIPIPEAYYAIGATDKIDVIGKISITSLHIEGRYQFIGDKVSPFAASVGLGCSLSFFGIEGSYSAFTLTPTIPLFFSYHSSDKFAFYVSPRYSFLTLVGDDTDGSLGVFALSGGLEMGNKVIFNIEGGFQSFHYLNSNPDNESAAILPQFSVGIAYRFGGNR